MKIVMSSISMLTIHGYAPLVNLLLLIGVVVLLIRLALNSRLPPALFQASELKKLEARIGIAERTAEAATVNSVRLRRDMEDSLNGVVQEIRHVGSRVEDIIADRAIISEVDTRTIVLERLYHGLDAAVTSMGSQLSSLYCAEVIADPQKFHFDFPNGICPLYKTPCPLREVSPSGSSSESSTGE